MSNAIEDVSDTSVTTAVSSAKEVAVDKTARRDVQIRDAQKSRRSVRLVHYQIINGRNLSWQRFEDTKMQQLQESVENKF